MATENKETDGTDHKDSQIIRRLEAQVDPKWADSILLGCFYCSGLIDSMAFNMYGCFVSMQTGNTIFIGLGVNGQPDSAPRYSWSKSLSAVLCFALGALFFSTFHRFFGAQKRWVLITSFAIQALLIGIVAVIATIRAIENHPPVVVTAKDSGFLTFTLPSSFPGSDFGPIALLAFQSAGQIVASRALKYNAIPTVVLTSLYCDLMSDAQLFTAPLGENPDRNRRFLGAVLLLAGAISGAYLTKLDAGFMGGLWIGFSLKVVMALAWFMWREKKGGEKRKRCGM
ncbi:hypothetical protein K458DRAFT_492565 [Lentithecium fluviatile CBS 122367]|uniref:DUF1275 domain protein n=1 Tax=Lentithecium fluviatile CBS 122367 TaxID=1168545 RepID=A0A6G1IDC7_9PLEO|nr:hypothetical protein K458DRAFT_492565 [Lentithecium fluviatile CBS 122367]